MYPPRSGLIKAVWLWLSRRAKLKPGCAQVADKRKQAPQSDFRKLNAHSITLATLVNWRRCANTGIFPSSLQKTPPYRWGNNKSRTIIANHKCGTAKPGNINAFVHSIQRCLSIELVDKINTDTSPRIVNIRDKAQ